MSLMSIQEIDEGIKLLTNAFKYRVRQPVFSHPERCSVYGLEWDIYKHALLELKGEPWYKATNHAKEPALVPTYDHRVFKWVDCTSYRVE